MKRYSCVMIYLIGWLMAVSCVDNDDRCTTLPVDENGEITKTFVLQLPSPIQAASTYAMQVVDENRIKTLDVLLFKVDQGNETYAYRVQATNITDVGNNSQYKEATIKLKADGNSYRLVFLANVMDEISTQIPDIASVGEKDLVLENLTHTFAADKVWNTGDAFAMWGESGIVTISDETSLDNEEIKMVRAVSRIDVIATALDNFELTSAHIYKYHRKGHVAPNPANIYSDYKAHTPTVPSEALMVDKSEPFAATDNIIMQEMYVYESEASNVHLEKTCVVVGGIYVPENYTGNVNDLKPSYYRIDLVDDNKKDIHLLRNYCYTLRIKSVTGDGYEDEDKAYESLPFNVDVEILEWNQGDITDIVFGQYFLGVSRSEIYMPAPAATTSIIVTTDYPGGWTATYQSAGNWLTGPSTAFTYIKQKDELSFNLELNDTGGQRIGYIHLQAGVLRHTIIVHQYPADEEPGPPDGINWLEDVGDANCYILSPVADGIRIPVNQANNDGVERIGQNDILDAEILWTDTPYPIGDQNCVIKYVGVSGHGKDGYIEVAANGINGNALVAVKVNGKIRWSWHIWVLEYHPSETQGSHRYQYGTFDIYWMDRNVGALTNEEANNKSIGLVYQWGRKDPFPGLDGFASEKPFKIYDKDGIETFIEYKSGGTLENSIENPMTFYTSTTGHNGDWITPSNDNLWSIDKNTVYYDPCPDGWTINQPIDIWQNQAWNLDFTFNQSRTGAVSDKIGYWPSTSGTTITGEFEYSTLGEEGYYWMGEANGLRAYNVEIKDSWSCVEVGGNFSRGQALSVRCIKE